MDDEYHEVHGIVKMILFVGDRKFFEYFVRGFSTVNRGIEVVHATPETFHTTLDDYRLSWTAVIMSGDGFEDEISHIKKRCGEKVLVYVGHISAQVDFKEIAKDLGL